MKSKTVAATFRPEIGLTYAITGFTDYLAARVLLNNGLLLQAATLASTSIEKYLKSWIAGSGYKLSGHISDWPVNEIANIARLISLNQEFLLLLGLVYKVRYLDNIKGAVSFSIERRKFLSELDRTVLILKSTGAYKRGSEVVDPYEAAKQRGEAQLVIENIMLTGVSREAYLLEPDLAVSYYFDAGAEMMSYAQTGWIAYEPDSFIKPGITRSGNTYQCWLRPPDA